MRTVRLAAVVYIVISGVMIAYVVALASGVARSTLTANTCRSISDADASAPHEPGRILFNDLGMLLELEGIPNAMGVLLSKTSSRLVGHGALPTEERSAESV